MAGYKSVAAVAKSAISTGWTPGVAYSRGGTAREGRSGPFSGQAGAVGGGWRGLAKLPPWRKRCFIAVLLVIYSTVSRSNYPRETSSPELASAIQVQLDW